MSKETFVVVTIVDSELTEAETVVVVVLGLVAAPIIISTYNTSQHEVQWKEKRTINPTR